MDDFLCLHLKRRSGVFIVAARTFAARKRAVRCTLDLAGSHGMESGKARHCRRSQGANVAREERKALLEQSKVGLCLAILRVRYQACNESQCGRERALSCLSRHEM